MYDIRTRYLADTVATASPARLLTMLYDRLLLDVDRAESALRAGDRLSGRGHLLHAQEIVSELIASLDVSAWDNGPRLLSIYTYLLQELVESSMQSDPDRTAACRGLIAPLGEAWHEASQRLAAVPTPRPTPGGVPGFADVGTATDGVLGVG